MSSGLKAIEPVSLHLERQLVYLKEIRHSLKECIDTLGTASTLTIQDSEMNLKMKMGEDREGIAFGGQQMHDVVSERVEGITSPLDDLVEFVTEKIETTEKTLGEVKYHEAKSHK